MKIKTLAIDQATKLSGVSIWQDGELVKYSLLDTNPKKSTPLQRLELFRQKFEELIYDEKPDFVCMEDIQFQQNYKTYKQLAQLQGIILSIVFRLNIPFDIVSPSSWRSFLGIKGRGREECKRNTKAYVRRKLKIKCSEDEADSICIGLWCVGNYKE